MRISQITFHLKLCKHHCLKHNDSQKLNVKFRENPSKIHENLKLLVRKMQMCVKKSLGQNRCVKNRCVNVENRFVNTKMVGEIVLMFLG